MKPVSLLLFAVLCLAGCTAPAHVVESQRTELDSLRAVAYALEHEVLALRDSLQFLDDIESGYYYREKGSLESRIDKLDYDLAVCRTGGLPVATLLVDDLFEPASATLTEAGSARLAALADTLVRAFAGHTIRVEGHTDSVPPGENLKKQFATNWELSAARATAVVRFLTEVHRVPAGQIEAVGYGASRPVARNDSAEGRRQNRRVRIAVLEMPNDEGRGSNE